MQTSHDGQGDGANTTGDDAPPQSGGYRWYALGLLTLCYAFAQLDRLGFNVLIEPMKREFGASDTEMGLLAGLAFVLFYTLFGVPVARYADRGNRPLLLSVSVIVWSAMTVATGFAANVIQAGIARIGLGIAEAGCVPASMSLISDLFPKARRAFASSIFQSGMAIGALLGVPVVGYVADAYGWRAALWVLGVPGLVLGLIVLLTMKEPRRAVARAAGIAAAADAPPRSSFLHDGMALLRDRRFALLLASQLSVGIAIGINTVWWTVLMQRQFGLNLKSVALYSAIYFGIVLMSGYLFSGYLTARLIERTGKDHLGATLPGVAALISVPFGVGAWLVQDLATSVAISIPFFFFLFMSRPAGNTLAVEFAPPQHRGLAVSLILLATNLLGVGVGPTLCGAISDSYAGSLGEVQALRTGILMTIPPGVVLSGLFLLSIGRVMAKSGDAVARPASTQPIPHRA